MLRAAFKAIARQQYDDCILSIVKNRCNFYPKSVEYERIQWYLEFHLYTKVCIKRQFSYYGKI